MNSSLGVVQRSPLHRLEHCASTPGRSCPQASCLDLRPGAATSRTRSALAVPPGFDGFLRATLCRFVAPCCRSWGSPRFGRIRRRRYRARPSVRGSGVSTRSRSDRPQTPACQDTGSWVAWPARRPHPRQGAGVARPTCSASSALGCRHRCVLSTRPVAALPPVAGKPVAGIRAGSSSRRVAFLVTLRPSESFPRR